MNLRNEQQFVNGIDELGGVSGTYLRCGLVTSSSSSKGVANIGSSSSPGYECETISAEY